MAGASDGTLRRHYGFGLLIAASLAMALSGAGCGGYGSGGNGGTGGASSPIGGGWHNFQGMATTNYYGMFHGFRGTTYDEVKSRVGVAGSLTGFSAAITTAPPTGSWTFTLFKNGVAESVACTITGASTGCLDATGCLELTAGDEIAVQVVPAGASANAGGPRWAAVFAAGSGCS